MTQSLPEIYVALPHYHTDQIPLLPWPKVSKHPVYYTVMDGIMLKPVSYVSN